MRVVEKRVEKAHDHRADAARLEQLGRFEQLLFDEFGSDIAMRRHDSLGDRDPVAAPDERMRLPGYVELQRKVVGPLVSSDMQDVAKAARRQHADFGAVVFDRDVGGDRRAMHDHRDIGRLDAS